MEVRPLPHLAVGRGEAVAVTQGAVSRTFGVVKGWDRGDKAERAGGLIGLVSLPLAACFALLFI